MLPVIFFVAAATTPLTAAVWRSPVHRSAAIDAVALTRTGTYSPATCRCGSRMADGLALPAGSGGVQLSMRGSRRLPFRHDALGPGLPLRSCRSTVKGFAAFSCCSF